jgi:hypothetical protein
MNLIREQTSVHEWTLMVAAVALDPLQLLSELMVGRLKQQVLQVELMHQAGLIPDRGI